MSEELAIAYARDQLPDRLNPVVAGLTGSWSKGRGEYYAYYHCRPGCRAVNVTKAKLEGLFGEIARGVHAGQD